VAAHSQADRRVEFGLFDWVDLAPGEDLANVYDTHLRLVAEADRGGFAVYHLAEHHGTPLGLAPSPALFLAAAARVTRRIRLAPTTFVLPLHDPLRLAQEIGMLDQLSHGRLEIGVGRGSSPLEAAMFGLTADEAAARFERDLPVLLDALETGVLRRLDGPGVPLHVRVAQRPHPPLWYPTSNPASLARLGGQAYNVIFGFGFASPPLSVVWEQSTLFYDRLRTAAARGAVRHAVPGTTPRFGIMRHVLVAPTDEEAVALGRPAFAAHGENFTHLWRLHGSDRFHTLPDYDDLVAAGRLFVGSPATVTRLVSEAVAGGEVNYFAGAVAWGSISLATSLRSLALLRDEVLPAVNEALATVRR
jgi:alkanesulfonate monooxygenase SsuD/methylene tetrahydromethanopterin reductase-like flavin-dependent oxidoreductase (luciferase family)